MHVQPDRYILLNGVARLATLVNIIMAFSVSVNLTNVGMDLYASKNVLLISIITGASA
jgi:hypothetical protein